MSKREKKKRKTKKKEKFLIKLQTLQSNGESKIQYFSSAILSQPLDR